MYVEEEQNEYGVPQGVVFSFPVTVDEEGNVEVVSGIEFHDELSQNKLKETIAELEEERAAVAQILK